MKSFIGTLRWIASSVGNASENACISNGVVAASMAKVSSVSTTIPVNTAKILRIMQSITQRPIHLGAPVLGIGVLGGIGYVVLPGGAAGLVSIRLDPSLDGRIRIGQQVVGACVNSQGDPAARYHIGQHFAFAAGRRRQRYGGF